MSESENAPDFDRSAAAYVRSVMPFWILAMLFSFGFFRIVPQFIIDDHIFLWLVTTFAFALSLPPLLCLMLLVIGAALWVLFFCYSLFVNDPEDDRLESAIDSGREKIISAMHSVNWRAMTIGCYGGVSSAILAATGDKFFIVPIVLFLTVIAAVAWKANKEQPPASI